MKKTNGHMGAAIAVLAALSWSSAICAAAGQTTRPKPQQKVDAADSSAADAAALTKLNGGQVDAAAAAFQAVLAVNPNDAGALAGMGQVRVLQGNYLGAVSFLEQAKQARPNDASISAALDGARFHFLMGEGKDAQTAKDAIDAEKRYREALELRPAAPEAVSALVNVLVVENKLSDAQDALSTAVAQTASASGHPPVELELQLAQLDIATGQPQLAYPIFLQVLQESPTRVDAWSGLVSALHLMGHDADAVAQEKAIPADTRGQLEATPGFQQMMAGIASGPAKPVAAGEPVYTPFVPSATPVAAAVATAPASVATPTATVATATTIKTSPHSSIPVEGESVKTTASRRAADASPRRVASASSQTATSVAAEAAPGSRAATGTGSGKPLVTQPAARPTGRNDAIPDTGEQQYPQPKARPRVAAAN